MKNKKKETQEIKAITEIIDGKMVVIASDESKDRVGESLKVDDWDFKNFKKNPVLQAGHDYRPQFTIGVAKNLRVEGKKVLFEPMFHSITSLGREIKEMFEQGILKAWSVGFIPGREKGDKNELLEVSAVAVPANANALVIAKGMKPEEEKEVKEKIDDFVSKEKPKKKKKDEKSPACRMEDETSKECVARKIPELVDEGMEQDQAVAAATNICKDKCKKKDDKKATFNCECIECGHKIKTSEHCKDIKCSECGGTMRRAERPGSGQKATKKKIKKDILKEIITDVKEGRVISSKNRKVITDAIGATKDAVAALEKLLELSEPTPKEEPVKVIPEESKKEVKKETPKKAEGNGIKQGREPRVAHKQISKEELAVRVLKQISKNSAFALNQLK